MYFILKWPNGKKRARKLNFRNSQWQEKVEEWAGSEIVACSCGPDDKGPVMRTNEGTKIQSFMRK